MSGRKYIVIPVVAVLLIVGLFTAQAAISGVFGFSRGSIILTGSVRGLGNVVKEGNDAIAVLEARAQVTGMCQNPGGRTVPGRSPIYVTLSVSQELDIDRNGNADVFIEIDDPDTYATPPVSPNPKEAGCPNGNWHVVGLEEGSTRWVSANVYVIKSGVTELSESFTCVDDGTTLSCE